MKIEEIIKNVNTKRELLNAVANSKFDEYEIAIKYYKIKPKFLRYLKKNSEKLYVYKYIPYVGIKTEDQKFVKELIDGYLHNKSSSVMKDIKKYVTINALDIAGTMTTIPPLKDGSPVWKPIYVHTTRGEGKLWNLEIIGAYYAQKYASGKNIKVAIIDTGVDYMHSELKDNFEKEKGYNFIEENNDPFDDNNHGTHVAGIIAGKTTGVAPNVTLYALKALDYNGEGSELDVVRGIEWALDKGIHIVNMSLGSNYASGTLREICAYASQNMILVAAAGNDGIELATYPAACDGVISVAAIDKYKNHAKFSNIHETIDISAPGVEIISTIPTNEYAIFSGTSMATPHVSGSLALLIEHYKEGLYEDLIKSHAEKLKNDTLPYDNEKIFGAGLIRIDKVIDYLHNKSIKRNKKRKLFSRRI